VIEINCVIELTRIILMVSVGVSGAPASGYVTDPPDSEPSPVIVYALELIVVVTPVALSYTLITAEAASGMLKA